MITKLVSCVMEPQWQNSHPLFYENNLCEREWLMYIFMNFIIFHGAAVAACGFFTKIASIPIAQIFITLVWTYMCLGQDVHVGL